MGTVKRIVFRCAVICALIFAINHARCFAQEGLVAYWSMDEGRGSVIKDKSGNNNHGRIHGAVWTEGKIGKALKFDGIDDYVDCGNDASLNVTDALTIEMWVKIDDSTAEKANRVAYVIWKKGAFDMSIRPFMVRRFTGQVHFGMWNQGTKRWSWTNNKVNVLPPGSGWIHIAATYGDNNVNIYVNGKKQTDISDTMEGTIDASANVLKIGQGLSYFFPGAIDEVRIYNRALSQEEIEERAVGKDMLVQAATLRSSLSELERRIQSLANLSLKEERWNQEIKRKLVSLKRKADREDISALAGIKKIEEVDLSIQGLDKILTALEKGKLKHKSCLTYIVRPMTNIKVLPSNLVTAGEISNTISMAACCGEYEPASFVLYSPEDITSLRVEPTNLEGQGGFIPSSNVDIKIVKCWYQWDQSGEGNIANQRKKRILLPELLLNDDSLVRVDYENKENYLKLSYPEGEKYVCVSQEKGVPGISRPRPSVKQFPVKDASLLLPVNIPARTNKQFWVTLKVPQDAKPGIYTGKLVLKNRKGLLEEINLRLRVLDFELSSPYYTSSLCTDMFLSHGEGTISREIKSRKQFKAEMENLFAHGVTNPYVAQPFDERLLDEVLKIRNEAGLKNQPFYYHGISTMRDPSFIKKVVEFFKSRGITEVYFYGRDEAYGEKLTRQRVIWEAVHKAGGKVFVAGMTEAIHPPGQFALAGDILDLFICAGKPNRDEAGKWHSVGHKIFCYGNPQAGVEEPLTYRRNFGLLLWQNDYDGASTWAYMGSFGNSWNDFDHITNIYKDEQFVYPTIDGVVDTIQWEGYREAVDDVRYLTTLLKAVEKAKKSKSKRIKEAVISAEKYLEELKNADLVKRNLRLIRLEIISHILQLTR